MYHIRTFILISSRIFPGKNWSKDLRIVRVGCAWKYEHASWTLGRKHFSTRNAKFFATCSSALLGRHSSTTDKGRRPTKGQEMRNRGKVEMSPQEREVRSQLRKQLRSASALYDDEKSLELDVFNKELHELERPETGHPQTTYDEEPKDLVKISDSEGLEEGDFRDDISRFQNQQLDLQITANMFEHLPPRCPGCGAFFQSSNPTGPGFVSMDMNPNITKKLFSQASKQITCKRCFDAREYNKPSYLAVSNDQIMKQLNFIERKKGLILYIVNVMDINGSMFPELLKVVGEMKRLLIVGNKVDMLPINQTPGQQENSIKNAIVAACLENGLSRESNIRDVLLVSAKTGFGLHQLAKSIQDHWDNNGDIYMVGCTNVGKTTLFNVMLDLFSVHKRKGDMLNRAVVSLWPGMTLSLMRFPLSYYKLIKLRNRLTKGPLKFYEMNHNRKDDRQYKPENLQHKFEEGNGRGSLFSKYVTNKEVEIEMDPSIIDVSQTSYKKYLDKSIQKRALVPRSHINMTSNLQLKDSESFGKPELLSRDEKDEEKRQAWFYDTPGIINDNQIYPLLTIEELKLLHPAKWFVPRTYILKPGETMLIGGLARIDYLDIKRKPSFTADGQNPFEIMVSNRSAYFTILASPNLPLHILNTYKADGVYEKHAGGELLKIPMGGEERMEKFPPLEGREFVIDGLEFWDSSADITLSSIGWVAVATGREYQVLVKAYTPQGRGLGLRSPAMLPHMIRQKGRRGVKYQGFIDYHGYEATRARSPNWEKFMEHGNKGTYEWLTECNSRLKEQRGEIKLIKYEQIVQKSLEGLPNFVTGNYPQRKKKVEAPEDVKPRIEATTQPEVEVECE